MIISARTCALAFSIMALWSLSACQPDKPVAEADKKPVPMDTKNQFVVTADISGAIVDGVPVKDGTPVSLSIDDFSTSSESGSSWTTVVKGASFTVTGSISQPMPAVVRVGKDTYGDFILESGSFSISSTESGLSVAGGEMNTLINAYKALPEYATAATALRKAEEGMSELDPDDEKAGEAAEEAIEPLYEKVDGIKAEYWAKLRKSDTRPYVALLIAAQGVQPMKGFDQQLAALAPLENELGAEPLYVNLKAFLVERNKASKIQDALAVGSMYKDLNVKDETGTSHRLSDVLAKNELVLLDFWASWCTPCRAEFPYLAKAYKEFHERGFEIYSVSLDDDRDAWLKALKEERAKGDIPWTQLVDLGMESPSAKAYGIQALPDSFLLDKNGKILGRQLQRWDLDKAVRKAMASSKIAGR